MARESFSDPGTARLINDGFVAVKVDREERPDVDRIYMDAVTALTGRGGWPLTVFLTPGGTPSSAEPTSPGRPATASPPSAACSGRCRRPGKPAGRGCGRRPTWPGAWPPPSLPRPAPGPRHSTPSIGRSRRAFDPEHGGFGGAPSSRRRPAWSSCCGSPAPNGLPAPRRWPGSPWSPWPPGASTTRPAAASPATPWTSAGSSPTSRRCSTTTPSSPASTCAGRRSPGEAAFAAVARSTLDYLLADLALPGGGFAAAEDADSEGEEGRFYAVGWDEFSAAAGAGAPLAAAALGVTPKATSKGAPCCTGPAPPPRWPPSPGPGPAEVEAAVAAALAGGARACAPAGCAPPGRQGRSPPGTAWPSGRWPRPPCWASRAAWKRRRRPPASSWPNCAAPTGASSAPTAGRGMCPRFCEDYGALALGLFALSPRRRRSLVVRRRRRPGRGHGAAVRRHGHRGLLRHRERRRDADRPPPQPVRPPHPLRQRPGRRGAAHPGRLHRRDRHLDRAAAVFRAAASLLERAPAAVGHLAGSWPRLAPPRELAVVGAPDDPATAALLAVAEEASRPDCSWRAATASVPAGPPAGGRLLVDGRPAAYLCRGFACEAPITDPPTCAACWRASPD